jgi:hypothetical protein
MGVILIVMGALGMVFSVYHLQSARRDFIAQFQPKPFHFCGNERKLDERTERELRDFSPCQIIWSHLRPNTANLRNYVANSGCRRPGVSNAGGTGL